MIVQEQDYASLEHYGVLGMRWGVRRANRSTAKVAKTLRKDLKGHRDQEDRRVIGEHARNKAYTSYLGKQARKKGDSEGKAIVKSIASDAKTIKKLDFNENFYEMKQNIANMDLTMLNHAINNSKDSRALRWLKKGAEDFIQKQSSKVEKYDAKRKSAKKESDETFARTGEKVGELRRRNYNV